MVSSAQVLQLPAGFTEVLAAERAAYRLPPDLPDVAEHLIHAYLALLFPHFTRGAHCRADGVAADADSFVHLLEQGLDLPDVDAATRATAGATLVAALPRIRAALLLDAAVTADGDPAASGVDEVILAYPGFFATAVHRMAHQLHISGVRLLARVVGELAHRATGIDIHPGAHLGGSFAIDHGTGVVIGETCVIGERVRLYQGVTLGALVVSKGMRASKRHPTVEDDVVIYSGATILGGDTVVGAGSRIGGNVWLTRSVAPGSVVSTSAGIDPRRPRGGTRNGSGLGAREDTDPALEFYL
ncbi:MAG: serine O-acetyltransferase [Mycobacteriaceae bacterium]